MTLAEMVISITIIGIVSVMATAAYVATVRLAQSEQTKSRVTLGAGRVLGPLDELLSQGVAVLSQYPISGAATVTTGTRALAFSIPSLDVNDESTVDTVDLVTVVLDTSISGNTRLLATIYPNAVSTRPAETIVVATNVLDVYFRYGVPAPTSSTVVGVTMRLKRAPGASQTLAISSTLRNHP
jgi:hypothetical protein